MIASDLAALIAAGGVSECGLSDKNSLFGRASCLRLSADLSPPRELRF